MKVHIFTSNKGGTGKSLLAYLASAFYLKSQKKVAIFDMTSGSYTLRNQFFPTKEKREINQEQKGNFLINKIDKSCLIYMHDKRDFSTTKTISQLFYSMIEEVLFNNFDKDAIIIDTSLTINNLKTDEDFFIKDLSILKKIELYIWFIFEHTIFFENREQADFERTLDWLEEHFNDFNEETHLIYVYNKNNFPIKKKMQFESEQPQWSDTFKSERSNWSDIGVNFNDLNKNFENCKVVICNDVIQGNITDFTWYFIKNSLKNGNKPDKLPKNLLFLPKGQSEAVKNFKKEIESHFVFNPNKFGIIYDIISSFLKNNF